MASNIFKTEIEIFEGYEKTIDKILSGTVPQELFYTEDLSSMEFSIGPAKEEKVGRLLKKLKSLIEKCGGLLHFNKNAGGLHTIRLISKGSTLINTVDDYFYTDYVLDCAAKKRLLDLNNYRVGKSQFTSEVDVMDILTRVKSWKDVVRICREVSGDEVSDFSEEDSSADAFRANPQKWRSRRYYGYVEDKEILSYILKTRQYSLVKGNVIWKKIEQLKVFEGRSWQSLRERYIKQIIPRIDQFKLSPRDKARVLNPFGTNAGLLSDESEEGSEKEELDEVITCPPNEKSPLNEDEHNANQELNSEKETLETNNSRNRSNIINTKCEENPLHKNAINFSYKETQSFSIGDCGNQNDNDLPGLDIQPNNQINGGDYSAEKANCSSGTIDPIKEIFLFITEENDPLEENRVLEVNDPVEVIEMVKKSELVEENESTEENKTVEENAVLEEDNPVEDGDEPVEGGHINSNSLKKNLDDKDKLIEASPKRMKVSPIKQRAIVDKEVPGCSKEHFSAALKNTEENDGNSANESEINGIEFFSIVESLRDTEYDLKNWKRRASESDDNSFHISESENDDSSSVEEYVQKDKKKISGEDLVLYRKNYTAEDDANIIKYIYKHSCQYPIKGNTLYQNMELRKILPGRSWHSLRERFLKRILPNIVRYRGKVSCAVIDSIKLHVSESKTKKNQCRHKRPKKYRYEEDIAILRFIADNKRYKEVKGRAMWMTMCARLKNNRRTWQSIKNRFLKNILFNLDCYKISSDEKRRFRALLKDGDNRSKRISESSDEDSTDTSICSTENTFSESDMSATTESKEVTDSSPQSNRQKSARGVRVAKKNEAKTKINKSNDGENSSKSNEDESPLIEKIVSTNLSENGLEKNTSDASNTNVTRKLTFSDEQSDDEIGETQKIKRKLYDRDCILEGTPVVLNAKRSRFDVHKVITNKLNRQSAINDTVFIQSDDSLKMNTNAKTFKEVNEETVENLSLRLRSSSSKSEKMLTKFISKSETSINKKNYNSTSKSETSINKNDSDSTSKSETKIDKKDSNSKGFSSPRKRKTEIVFTPFKSSTEKNPKLNTTSCKLTKKLRKRKIKSHRNLNY